MLAGRYDVGIIFRLEFWGLQSLYHSAVDIEVINTL